MNCRNYLTSCLVICHWWGYAPIRQFKKAIIRPNIGLNVIAIDPELRVLHRYMRSRSSVWQTEAKKSGGGYLTVQYYSI